MTRVDKPALLKRTLRAWHRVLRSDPLLRQDGRPAPGGRQHDDARTIISTCCPAAGLLTGLPKYGNQPNRRRRSSPKLNVLNPALMTAGSGYTFEEARADRSFWGRIVESAVGAHLFNTAAPETQLHYWRESPHEVDFVLRRGPRLVAIEVKSGSARMDRRGMGEFERRFRPDRSLIVGERGIPLDEFLTAPADRWFEET